VLRAWTDESFCACEPPRKSNPTGENFPHQAHQGKQQHLENGRISPACARGGTPWRSAPRDWRFSAAIVLRYTKTSRIIQSYNSMHLLFRQLHRFSPQASLQVCNEPLLPLEPLKLRCENGSAKHSTCQKPSPQADRGKSNRTAERGFFAFWRYNLAWSKLLQPPSRTHPPFSCS
jgi:hypothetical protein